jgi:hypothetical protein
MWKSVKSSWSVTPQQQLYVEMAVANSKIRRATQIASLRSSFQNVQELKVDMQYEIPFQTQGMQATIVVTLGPTFPESPPIIQIKPSVKHAWVASGDGSTIVGHEKLHPSEWNMHTSLGKMVKEVIQEFTVHPPLALNGSSNSSAMNDRRQIQPGPSTRSIEVPLSDLTDEQVEELLNDPLALEVFVEDLDVFKKMRSVRDELKTGNETLAKKSMDREPVVTQLQQQLGELRQQLSTERAMLDKISIGQQAILTVRSHLVD